MRYPDVAGKTFIHARTGSKIHIMYRHSKYYYTYYRESPSYIKGIPPSRQHGKIALHHLFSHYLEVITPCATVSGGTLASV